MKAVKYIMWLPFLHSLISSSLTSGFVKGFSTPRSVNLAAVPLLPHQRLVSQETTHQLLMLTELRNNNMNNLGKRPAVNRIPFESRRGVHTTYFSALCALPPTAEEENGENDDDGWGSNTNIAQERELASLRSQMAEKNGNNIESNSSSSSSSSSRTNSNGEPERDLFIPIFAVVSLTGLFGAYGYEMLRLYSRGELYLPWNQ